MMVQAQLNGVVEQIDRNQISSLLFLVPLGSIEQCIARNTMAIWLTAGEFIRVRRLVAGR